MSKILTPVTSLEEYRRQTQVPPMKQHSIPGTWITPALSQKKNSNNLSPPADKRINWIPIHRHKKIRKKTPSPIQTQKAATGLPPQKKNYLSTTASAKLAKRLKSLIDELDMSDSDVSSISVDSEPGWRSYNQ
nr:ORF3 [Red fox Torque teno virus 1]